MKVQRSYVGLRASFMDTHDFIIIKLCTFDKRSQFMSARAILTKCDRAHSVFKLRETESKDIDEIITIRSIIIFEMFLLYVNKGYSHELRLAKALKD